MNFKGWFLRWIIFWAGLVDALCGILSLGFWYTHLGYRMATKYARYQSRSYLKKK